MSSLAAKKQKTLATRRRTKTRRAGPAADEDGTGRGDDCVISAQPEAAGACTLGEGPGYIPAAEFAGSRPGYAFKLGPCGLGYYRDATDGSREDGTHPEAGSTEATGERDSKPARPEPRLMEVVAVVPTAEEGLERAIKFYKSVRARDGRQKARVVVVVDSDKPLARLPPRFGAQQVKTKMKSKKGLGSASKSKFAYVGSACLQSPKEDLEVAEVVGNYRSGKVSTVYTTDECVKVLAPLASLTQVVIQVTRFPSLAAFRQRRALLVGQFGQETLTEGRQVRCFYSSGSRPGLAQEASALAQRLKMEGQQITSSLAELAGTTG